MQPQQPDQHLQDATRDLAVIRGMLTSSCNRLVQLTQTIGEEPLPTDLAALSPAHATNYGEYLYESMYAIAFTQDKIDRLTDRIRHRIGKVPLDYNNAPAKLIERVQKEKAETWMKEMIESISEKN